MEKHIVDEKTGIPYTLVGDYYLPWGDLPDDEPKQRPIGIWGQRHMRYIKQNKKSLYIELKMSGKLNSYLANLNDEAEEMFSRLVKQTAEKQGVTLVRNLCCNCIDGNCLLLDDGEEHQCVQLLSLSGIYCNYFRKVVLPADKKLYAEIIRNNQKVI